MVGASTGKKIMKSKKRILQIIPTLDRCGAEKQMTLLATHLPKDEFEVGVVVLTRSGPFEKELKEAGIPVRVIGKRAKIDLLGYGRLKQEIRRFKPDVVHTWLFAANTYGRQAALACRVPHIIAGERCVDPWKGAWHFMIDRYLTRRTDGIVTNSTGVVDFYVRNGIPVGNFTVIPNAAILPDPSPEPLSVDEILSGIGISRIVPTGDYHPVVDSKYDFDRELLLSVSPESLSRQTPYVIGIVARLWPQKRIKDLLWVFETLKFVNFNYHVLIIGDGPERDDLLRCRDSWKLADRVHFLGQRNDVPKIMSSFDILLSCSEYEGQSNSILEAMAGGVPVIATDIPGNRDLVVDGETGILVPDCGEDFRRRRRLFVERTLNLLENADLRKKFAANARKRIEEHFNLNQMIDRHIDLYRALCEDANINHKQGDRRR